MTLKVLILVLGLAALFAAAWAVRVEIAIREIRHVDRVQQDGLVMLTETVLREECEKLGIPFIEGEGIPDSYWEKPSRPLSSN